MCEYLLLPGRKSDRRLVEVDDFVRQLWELYIEIKKEGIAQVHLNVPLLIVASIFRSLSIGLHDPCRPV